jgi:hypothetical protein
MATLFASDPTVSCATGVAYNRFQPSDMIWLNDVAAKLDATIATAAQDAGVTYVSDYNAFAGHELCSTDPYLYHALVTALSSRQAEVGSFHPTQQGQLTLSRLVEKAAS